MEALIIVKPETVICWQQKRFKKYWTKKSAKKNKPGRPSLKLEIRKLIRKMASENLSWGAPRIYSELLMLGYTKKQVSQRTVSRYLKKIRVDDPGNTRKKRQQWKTFLKNHLESSPKYLIFDRDCIFSARVKQFITNIGTRPKVTGYKCPWQNGVAERYVLSVRNDMLNQMVIFNEEQLRDLLKQYVVYYNNERCHLSVDRDSPTGREIQYKPFGSAKIISFPRIGGLHHIYKWDKAA